MTNIFWGVKVWIIGFQTHYQPCFYDIYLSFYTLKHMRSQTLKKHPLCRKSGPQLDFLPHIYEAKSQIEAQSQVEARIRLKSTLFEDLRAHMSQSVER